MSGRLARGIPNRAMRDIETAGLIAPSPRRTGSPAHSAVWRPQQDRGDLLSLWAGQSAALATRADAREVFAELRAGVVR